MFQKPVFRAAFAEFLSSKDSMIRELFNLSNMTAVTCLLVTVSCVPVAGQVAVSESDPGVVVELIDLLDSPDFGERIRAEKQVRSLGDAAIGPLREAEKVAAVGLRERIRVILKELERNSFDGRLAALQDQPSKSAAALLPMWERFAAVVGDDEQAITFYIRLLQAERGLFAAVESQSGSVTELLEQRASSVLQSTRPSPEPREKFSADSFAALLLLCGDERVRLGSASTAVSSVLLYDPFLTALQDGSAESVFLERLAGSYILRDRIAPARPLTFVRRHPLPEGLMLAHRVLQSLRGTNGLFALMVIAEQGDADDVPSLEKVFDNRGILIRQGTLYSVTNGDLAMCVAIRLRGADPRDFGFAPGVDRTVPFVFAPETAGFRSDEDRRQAREKYRTAFQAAE